LVLVAAQQDGKRIGRIRLRRITDASGHTPEAATEGMIAPGSRVRTDGWWGYNGLEAHGYSHEVIRQETSLGDNLLPLANRVASLLKPWLLGTHQGAVRRSHLDYYLDEFSFRFNRRTSGSRGKTVLSPRPTSDDTRSRTGQIDLQRDAETLRHNL
jgi:hypothetical protein